MSFMAPKAPKSGADEQRAREAAEAERKRLLAAKGRSSTILTGEETQDQPNTQRKTLLGG